MPLPLSRTATFWGPLKPALAPQDRDPGTLQGFGEIGPDRRHQLGGVVSYFLPLETHRCRVDAKAGKMVRISQLPHPTTGRQQGLGGHTAPVDAGATHIAGFDDGHLEPMVGPMLGRIKAPVARTDHDHIKNQVVCGRDRGWGGGSCRHRDVANDECIVPPGDLDPAARL